MLRYPDRGCHFVHCTPIQQTQILLQGLGLGNEGKKWNRIIQQGKSTYNTKWQNLQKKQEQRAILFKSPSNCRSHFSPALPPVHSSSMYWNVFLGLIIPYYSGNTSLHILSNLYELGCFPVWFVWIGTFSSPVWTMGIVASNPYGLMDSSFFVLDSLFKHTYWSVCLKYLRGTLYRSMEFCLCAVYSTTSSCLGLSALSQLSETSGLCPGCSCLLHNLETPLGSKLEEL